MPEMAATLRLPKAGLLVLGGNDLGHFDLAAGVAAGVAPGLLGGDLNAQMTLGELGDDTLIQKAEGRLPLEVPALRAVVNRDHQGLGVLHRSAPDTGRVPG